MWNIRRGCQPFFQQFGIMPKQPPSAENQMTGKQQYDEPRSRPIDASSNTEEHAAEGRQLHDALHKDLHCNARARISAFMVRESR